MPAAGETVLFDRSWYNRSGDVFIVFEPNRFTNDFDGLTVASTHGSPWNYGTYVPIVFAGAGLAAMTVDRKVQLILPRPLFAFLSIKPPSGAVGEPLVEVTRTAGR